MADDDARRAEFRARAPELRAAFVAELTALASGGSDLNPDEAALLLHLSAHAGLAMSGGLFLPALEVLWGETASYIPPVALEPVRVRAAARVLRRRGVLRPDGDGWLVVLEPLKPAAATAAPVARKSRAKSKPRPKPKAGPKPRAKRR